MESKVRLRVRVMPRTGRLGRVAGTREVTIAGTPYLVAYRIVEKIIHVVAILHGDQNWPDSF